MSVQELVALLSALVGIPIALERLWGTIRQKSPRDLLLQDIEIRNALPSGSEAQKRFDAHIDTVAATLTNTSIRRDWGGAAIGILFLLLAALCYWLFTTVDGWWHWLFILPLAFFLLFGVFGTADSLQSKERNTKKDPPA